MTSTGSDALLLAVYQAALALSAILYGVLGLSYGLFVNLLQNRPESDPLPKGTVVVAFRRICRGTCLLILLTTAVAGLSLWGLSSTGAVPLLLGTVLVAVAALAALGACYLAFFTML